MKKLMSIILAIGLAFLLSGCKGDEVTISVIAPLGSPALAQTYMQSVLPSIGEDISYDVEVVSGTDPLIAAFGSESHEIIYAPTNLGAKLISTGVPYKFAATVVWGNLYLATGTDNSFSMSDLDGKEIIIFGQGATPEIIVQTVLNAQTWTSAPTISFVPDAGTALATLVTDPSKIVLLAEPVLSIASSPSKVVNLKSISLQTAWADISGESSYPQAGIFIHKDMEKDVVNGYLEAVKNSINQALTNTPEVAQMAVDLEYATWPLSVIQSAIPRSNLEFKTASDSKVALETYFQYILDFNPKLIGGSLPDDTFYFQ